MRHVVILAVAAAVAAVPAAAQPKQTDSRVAAAIACASVKDGEQRLRCYDQAVANLTQAVQSGTLVGQKTVAQPKSLEGVVKASGGQDYGRFWVMLDNGDRWVVAAKRFEDPPRPGAKVTLNKSPLGSYFFDEPGHPPRRARFLGGS